MTVVNLFFIPAFSVWIFYKLKGKELKFNTEFSLVYMMFASVVAISAKLILFMAKYLFETQQYDAGSAYFSVAAIIVSLIIPFIASVFHAVDEKNVEENDEENDEENEDK